MRSSLRSCMEMRGRETARIGLVLLCAVILSAAASLCLGAVPLSPGRIAAVVLSGDRESVAARVLFYVRMPRTLACLVSGAALAVSGAVIQSVLENPLAAPNVIGVNTGAGLAVVLCGILFPGRYLYTPAAASLGALLGALLVLGIGERTGASRLSLVLAGIAVSAVFSGGIDLAVTFVPDALAAYADFRIGGFSGVSMRRTAPASAAVGTALLMVLLLTPQMDLLALGTDTARSLGLRARPARIALLTAAAALAGSAVSMAGLLGFVGLIVPHAVRRASHGEGLILVTLSALGGAALVTACDLASRTLFAPYEIPVGVTLSLLGGPFFLFLVLRKRGGRDA